MKNITRKQRLQAAGAAENAHRSNIKHGTLVCRKADPVHVGYVIREREQKTTVTVFTLKSFRLSTFPYSAGCCSDLCWNLFGAVSGKNVSLTDQAAKSTA